MLVGTAAAATMHLIMVACPVNTPNDAPSCTQVVLMDLYGPTKDSRALCELNVKFLNPNIKQEEGFFMETTCWEPKKLARHKTVL